MQKQMCSKCICCAETNVFKSVFVVQIPSSWQLSLRRQAYFLQIQVSFRQYTRLTSVLSCAMLCHSDSRLAWLSNPVCCSCMTHPLHFTCLYIVLSGTTTTVHIASAASRQCVSITFAACISRGTCCLWWLDISPCQKLLSPYCFSAGYAIDRLQLDPV